MLSSLISIVDCKKSSPIEFKNELINKLINRGIIDKSEIFNVELIDSRLEQILMDEISNQNFEACFQLGQLYFHKDEYSDAIYYFNLGFTKIGDYQCIFQLGIIYYDGLGRDPDHELGCAYMKKIYDNKELPETLHLIHTVAYNLGRAYYQGYGVGQSDTEAEKYWLFAADDGNPQASVMAQSALGFFYSTKQHLDYQKAFFWHSEACGNGGIESQACLGVMYLYGVGIPIDWEASLICLSNASDRGSVYAQANLSYYFYKRKLYTKAADIASKVSQLEDEESSNLSKHSSVIIDEYLRKGIAIACFIFGRCLHMGRGVLKDCEKAYVYYSKSFEWDPDLCSDFQKLTQQNQL